MAQDDPTREVAVGEPGELAVGGPQVFGGWWRRPDEEGVFTADGALLTGDVAVMDADGWFTVVDRKKELIIAGGFNIYPSEVEAVLARVPGVAEAVVVGVPDRYRGETVKAYVVRAPGSDVGRRRCSRVRGGADGVQGAAAGRVRRRAAALGGRQGAAAGAGRAGARRGGRAGAAGVDAGRGPSCGSSHA